jgi:hypothetical protein
MTEWKKLVEWAERDPEEAFEEALNSLPPLVADEEREAQRQAQHASHMARLKERQAELQRKLAALGGKSDVTDSPRSDDGPEVRDVLTYLASYSGNDYAQAEVEGELLRLDLEELYQNVKHKHEALVEAGETPYLDKDHDFATKLFLIDRFYFRPNEGVFAEGRWTAEGLRLRPRKMGVSPNFNYSDKHPPSQNVVIAKKRQMDELDERIQPVDSMGVLGAVCCGILPTFFYDTPETLAAVKAGKLSCPPPVVIDLTTG